MANEIVEMVDVAIPQWLDEMIYDFDEGHLPEWLANYFKASHI